MGRQPDYGRQRHGACHRHRTTHRHWPHRPFAEQRGIRPSKDVPELRIVDDELWQAVKARQAAARKRTAQKASAQDDDTQPPHKTGFWTNQRPKHLLTGLMRCGACGGGYVKISSTQFGCATARNKGTCDNRLNIRVDRLDDIVLSGLKTRLMNPELYQEFLASYIAERNRILAQRNAHYTSAQAELAKLKTRQKVLVQALADGVPARTVKDEMIALEAREDELNALLTSRPATEPSLHPNLATIYREKVAALHEALADPATKDEAFTIIRTLIDEVRLVPENGELRVELRGALAGILALGSTNTKTARFGTDGSVSVLEQQMNLVAGPHNTRSQRNGTSVLEIGVSQESVVAGAGNARYLQLVDRKIPFVFPSLSIGAINGTPPTRCSLSS